jgi:hypothetical protein
VVDSPSRAVEHYSAACKRFGQDNCSAVLADQGNCPDGLVDRDNCFDGLVDQDMSIGMVAAVVLQTVDKGSKKEAGKAEVQTAEVDIGLG